jgi:hypothetical protein
MLQMYMNPSDRLYETGCLKAEAMCVPRFFFFQTKEADSMNRSGIEARRRHSMYSP